MRCETPLPWHNVGIVLHIVLRGISHNLIIFSEYEINKF